MRLIDTHCHLDLYPNYKNVIKETESAGIYTIAVTNTPSVFRPCAKLLQGLHFLYPALGLHPQLAMQRQNELQLLLTLLPETRFIGEVGLDYVTSDETERSTQKHIFGAVLESCAIYGDKVLTVHSRRSASEVVAMIGNNYPGTIVLHWFSGTLKVLERAIGQNCYFSINSSMLTSVNGRRILAAIPRQKVLTETDGPFVKLRGEPAQPRDIYQVVSTIAQFWELDLTATAQIIHENFKRALTHKDGDLPVKPVSIWD